MKQIVCVLQIMAFIVRLLDHNHALVYKFLKIFCVFCHKSQKLQLGHYKALNPWRYHYNIECFISNPVKGLWCWNTAIISVYPFKKLKLQFLVYKNKVLWFPKLLLILTVFRGILWYFCHLFASSHFIVTYMRSLRAKTTHTFWFIL